MQTQTRPKDRRKLVRTSVPGVFKREPAGTHPYVLIWRHRGRQHKEYFRTFAEARERKGQVQAGDRRPTLQVRFEDFYDRWIDTYAGRTERGLTETTRTEYRRLIERHVLDRWRAWKVGEIEPPDVRALFSDLRSDGVGGPTLRKLRTALSSLFAYRRRGCGAALEPGARGAHPAADRRAPRQGQAGAGADARRAWPAARGAARRLAAVLRVACPLGAAHQRGDRARRWEHVDLGTRPRLLVRERVYRGERGRTKSDRSEREVPLSAGLAERLRACAATPTGASRRRCSPPRRAGASPVEPEPAGCSSPPRSRPGCCVAEAWAAPDKPESWVSFHTFRHTCASLLFEAGKDVKQVQEWLGHADPGFTLRTYVHLMDDGLGDADFLDRAVVVVEPEPSGAAT